MVVNLMAATAGEEHQAILLFTFLAKKTRWKNPPPKTWVPTGLAPRPQASALDSLVVSFCPFISASTAKQANWPDKGTLSAAPPGPLILARNEQLQTIVMHTPTSSHKLK